MIYVFFGIIIVVDDIFYEYKNIEVVIDLVFIVVISFRKKGILIMNEVNIFNSKFNKLGDDFVIFRDDFNVFRDDGI